LTDDDIAALAGKLGLPEQDFLMKYCKTVCLGGRFRVSLLERPNGDCLFIEDEGCSVYEARPEQCRTFPYWEKLMNSDEELVRAQEYCPGIKQTNEPLL
jgi:Fe-S-cluster containining protein